LTSQIDSTRGAVKGTQAYDILIFCCFSNQASISPWASFEKDFENNFFHTLTEHTGKYLFDESYEKKIWKRVHSPVPLEGILLGFRSYVILKASGIVILYL
jgi:hypothetical protein